MHVIASVTGKRIYTLIEYFDITLTLCIFHHNLLLQEVAKVYRYIDEMTGYLDHCATYCNISDFTLEVHYVSTIILLLTTFT